MSTWCAVKHHMSWAGLNTFVANLNATHRTKKPVGKSNMPNIDIIAAFSSSRNMSWFVNSSLWGSLDAGSTSTTGLTLNSVISSSITPHFRCFLPLLPEGQILCQPFPPEIQRFKTFFLSSSTTISVFGSSSKVPLFLLSQHLVCYTGPSKKKPVINQSPSWI